MCVCVPQGGQGGNSTQSWDKAGPGVARQSRRDMLVFMERLEAGGMLLSDYQIIYIKSKIGTGNTGTAKNGT